ncbi:Uncharacterised protein [Streptococcus porcinus]|nr:hypothetical protein [Streptococcus porcinus]VTS33217.1 Uncharacterised protein [Streptococcus porcinus]
MKKLLNLIFAKTKQEEKPKWTIEQNGWEQSARKYDTFTNRMGV